MFTPNGCMSITAAPIPRVLLVQCDRLHVASELLQQTRLDDRSRIRRAGHVCARDEAPVDDGAGSAQALAPLLVIEFDPTIRRVVELAQTLPREGASADQPVEPAMKLCIERRSVVFSTPPLDI
jgi:hypothetical protein